MTTKIAYISGTFGLASETFITDLVYSFNTKQYKTEVFCDTIKNGSKKTSEIKIHETKFIAQSFLSSKWRYRLARISSKQNALDKVFEYRYSMAGKKLYKYLAKYKPNIAFIDYGTIAVMAIDALVSLNIPFIVHFHGADITSALANTAYIHKLHVVFKKVSSIIVASEHVKRLLILQNAPIDKIKVVHLGINAKNIKPVSWETRLKNNPSIIFLGRLTPKKGPTILLEAFALVKKNIQNAELHIVGDGPEISRIKTLIKQKKITNSVILYGEKNRDDSFLILKNKWIYAQHSITAQNGDQEGFGISLAEASAYELPVVSTLHNGIPEQITDGKNGFLVREYDFETMAEKIIYLIKNPDIAKKLGKNGRKNVLNNYPTEKRIEAIQNIIEEYKC